jgi:hypothetical protein
MREKDAYGESNGSSSGMDGSSDDGGEQSGQGQSGRMRESDNCSNSDGDNSSNSGDGGSSGNSRDQGSNNRDNSCYNSGDDSNPSSSLGMKAGACHLEFELMAPRAVRQAGGDGLVMALMRRIMVPVRSSGSGQRVFVLEKRGGKRAREDSQDGEGGGEAQEVEEVGRQAHVRETMVFNEAVSTTDLCGMVWQSARKSGSGVDPLWHLMMAKHLHGYAKDAVTMHAAAASTTNAQMLVQMSTFGLAVKYMAAEGGVPQVCLSHRIVIPTSADGDSKMRTPWADSSFAADGKLHAVTDKDYLCALVLPAAEWAGKEASLQVLVWHLKEQETGLVIYHSQCFSMARSHVCGTSARRMPHFMTVEGAIQGRLDLDRPYHYLHAFDRATPRTSTAPH